MNRRHFLRNGLWVAAAPAIFIPRLKAANIAAFLGGSPPSAWSPPSTGLAAWYKFDDGSGTSATDSSGNARTGTLGGTSVPTWVAGRTGGAVQISNTSGYIDLGADFLGTGAISIAAWIYINASFTTAGRVIDNGKLLFFVTNARLNGSRDGATVAQTADGTISVNTWTHVAITTPASGNAKFYINGSASGTPATPGTPAAATTNLYAGNRSAQDRPLNGKIDSLLLYTVELNTSQIADIAANS